MSVPTLIEYRQQIQETLLMLKECQAISVACTIEFARLKGHPAYDREGLPELLRAQSQNATALCVQAIKIWEFMLGEPYNGDAGKQIEGTGEDLPAEPK